MVARSGRGWRLAPCLIAMEDEANTLAPQRQRQADGSIGDAAHSARTSDHNPADGWVCAIDLTHAPAHGFDAHARARMVVARRDPRIKYVISDGQVARSYPKPGIPAWTWANYTGANQHLSHAHFSIHNTATARNDLRPWWPQSDDDPEEYTVSQFSDIMDTLKFTQAMIAKLDERVRSVEERQVPKATAVEGLRNIKRIGHHLQVPNVEGGNPDT